MGAADAADVIATLISRVYREDFAYMIAPTIDGSTHTCHGKQVVTARNKAAGVRNKQIGFVTSAVETARARDGNKDKDKDKDEKEEEDIDTDIDTDVEQECGCTVVEIGVQVDEKTRDVYVRGYNPASQYDPRVSREWNVRFLYPDETLAHVPPLCVDPNRVGTVSVSKTLGRGKVYICVATGAVHLCGERCRAYLVTPDGGKTCPLSCMQLGYGFAPDWQETAEPLMLDKPDEGWKHASEDLVVLPDPHGRAGYERLDLSGATISASKAGYALAYGAMVLRFKKLLCVLLFGPARRRMDENARATNAYDEEKFRRRYTGLCATRGIQWNYQALRALSIGHQLRLPRTRVVQPPPAQMNTIAAYYAKIVAKLLIVLVGHAKPLGESPVRKTLAHDHVFVTVMSMMKNNGLEVGGRVVFPPDKYLKSQLPDLQQLLKMSKTVTETTKVVKKLAASVPVEIAQRVFPLTIEDHDDREAWNTTAAKIREKPNGGWKSALEDLVGPGM